jgi:hypothetical protein
MTPQEKKDETILYVVLVGAAIVAAILQGNGFY